MNILIIDGQGGQLGAQLVKEGKAYGNPVNIFGNEVTLYKFSYGGFLCDPKKDSEEALT